MKFKIAKKDYLSLTEIIKEVDKRSYFPSYKDMLKRLEQVKTADAADKNKLTLNLEETEIFVLFDALAEFEELAEKVATNEEKKKREAMRKDLISKLQKETGINV